MKSKPKVEAEVYLLQMNIYVTAVNIISHPQCLFIDM